MNEIIATKLANAMKEQMVNPDEWDIRVWDNLGWAYEIRKPHMSISTANGERFICYADLPCLSQGNFTTYGSTPQGAYESACLEMGKYVNQFMQRLNEFRGMVDTYPKKLVVDILNEGSYVDYDGPVSTRVFLKSMEEVAEDILGGLAHD